MELTNCSAVERLEHCQKQPTFAVALDQCRSRVVATGNLLHLTDMLIKPVQRICKYPLLIKVRKLPPAAKLRHILFVASHSRSLSLSLVGQHIEMCQVSWFLAAQLSVFLMDLKLTAEQELIKLTPADHPDLEPLEEALVLLEVTTKNINTSKGAAENMERLRELQRNIDGFVGTLAIPGRSLCLEGALQKVNPRGKVQTRQFFLLSDMLIWCKPKTMKKGHYIYKGMLRLDLAVVRDTKDEKG